jgi:hypothetical protein
VVGVGVDEGAGAGETTGAGVTLGCGVGCGPTFVVSSVVLNQIDHGLLPLAFKNIEIEYAAARTTTTRAMYLTVRIVIASAASMPTTKQKSVNSIAAKYSP